MKKLIKIVAQLFSIILIVFLVDLYIYRGYFTSGIVNHAYNKKYSEPKEILSDDLELNISKKSNFYQIKFKNKSYKPYLAWTYRWNTLFNVNDSLFFKHLRYKSYLPKYKNTYWYGLDCGTGAGVFSINPYESFSLDKSYTEIVNMIYWSAHHYNNSRYDTIKDLIHNKPLLLVDRDKDFKIFKRNDLSKNDSTDIEFYLPLFNYKQNKITYVKSNKIKISYLDVVKVLIEDEKKTHEEFKNF